ncbi:MAG: radical SAM protein [Gammaproteobacteria bacterium]|nr:radical SAM protein [Gammaproteobacteria bacterium]
MYNPFPVEYIEPLFRPPSEGRSLIFQVTNGCSWNRCTYCDMYTEPQKKFHPRVEADVLDEIRKCGDSGAKARRVFLADGDAMVLSMRRLRRVLQAIKTHLPEVRRVSAYCLPKNLKNKSIDELHELQDLGLTLLYIGAESGDDTVLKYIDKGETYRSTADALIKAHTAGLKTSVMILNGIGGRAFSEQHALESARLLNETQPHYVATLVLTFYRGQQKVIDGYAGNFIELNTTELCKEMRSFIGATELESSIFRSDHVSNHLVLKGVLGKDKQAMLEQIDQAIEHFQQHPEIERGGYGF